MLIFLFERDQDGTGITTFGDSLFWTNNAARVLDVFLQAYAISAVAILAGSFGTFFHRRGNERDPPERPGGRELGRT